MSGKAVQQVLGEGRSRSIGQLRLQFRPNGLSFVRLAQVIPKRLAPRAVDRNRVRRLVREMFRLEQSRWAGYDCVVRLRSPYEPGADLPGVARRLIIRGPEDGKSGSAFLPEE